ncbi:VOC family protein [uncultured Corynebacterium sp.]|uniref:VOC family protein n=1 Tax=uncultured Corynebacterium sp. TaxID=159447 RepID=UPI002593E2BD|nr:VOC family protein [uncultured Corynebacterium sp.]
MTMNPQNSQRTDHSIWPALFSDDPHALRRFLTGLGFEEGIVVPAQSSTQAGGEVVHSELLWPEGGRIMIASISNDHPSPHQVDLYVVTDHPDEVYAKAITLGAEITHPLAEQNDHDSRGFSLRDPDGNGWSFGTYGG